MINVSIFIFSCLESILAIEQKKIQQATKTKGFFHHAIRQNDSTVLHNINAYVIAR